MKDCGILLHISGLPGESGIGSLGAEAYRFVDWLKSAGQRYWQVLPLGHTSYGDSPYQTLSVNAFNPYFIDLKLCSEEGLIDYYPSVKNCGFVDYGALYAERYKTLKAIRLPSNCAEFDEFCVQNAAWLDDYAIFAAIKNAHGGKPWSDWDDGLRMREPSVLDAFTHDAAEEIRFYKILQYICRKQWNSLKNYANALGIEIIGDMPIYVAYDSADVWANPELFDLDEKGRMNRVAGVPPDYFSATGQLWGNPLYNWKRMESDGYQWWLERIRGALRLFDVLRIDHFRGFDTYWAIPSGSADARGGKWLRGPSKEFFKIVNAKISGARIIAEDLGEKSPTVVEMLRASGYPGMRVLQFGLTSSPDSEHRPENYSTECIAYTGTHDNDTLSGWLSSLTQSERDVIRAGYGIRRNMNFSLIETVYASAARTVIVPIQDIIGAGSAARLNVPSKPEGNWRWRLKKLPSNAVAARLLKAAVKYNRGGSDESYRH